MNDQAALLRELMSMSQEERDAIVRMFNEVAVSEAAPEGGERND